MRLVSEVWVPGTPRPKGSMKSLGPGGTLVPDDYDPKTKRSASREWAQLVRHAAKRDLADRWGRRGNSPYVARHLAVWVDAVFFMPSPNDAMLPSDYTAAIAERIGDTDKLVRNVLDALKGAGAYVDDVQVDRAHGDRVYALGVFQPGAHIVVREQTPEESRELRWRAELAARQAYELAVTGTGADTLGY